MRDDKGAIDLRRENGPDVMSNKSKGEVYDEAMGHQPDSLHSHDPAQHSKKSNDKHNAKED